ncbi:hypothetical protein HYH03_019129 [Edaphochlamys debaryana]|uniref:Uncharacterized protein n=1 Tax=Edaphochlamys debaryana TaxID=47281 RepID=A0A836BNN6_9CHLO|nr:hypothetical protein HYH03_019129 [Edaphochlamys debaryana]|eukprot:KAG2481914.1 hypothetical protein HYH03_019129 [Edaphochlamys debaryana]
MTHARMLQTQSQGGAGAGGGAAAAAGGAPPPVYRSGAAPLPRAAIRNAYAAATHQPPPKGYAGGGGGGAPGGAAAARSTSAPRDLPSPHHAAPGGRHGQSLLSPSHRSAPGQAQSEARIPAVAAATATAAGRVPGPGPGAPPLPPRARGPGAPSEAGTNASWWRTPVTDASYPLTAITDRYAQSMSPSELVRWNDRVTRLEAEVNAEKARRQHFEKELKRLQASSSGGGGAFGTTGGR